MVWTADVTSEAEQNFLVDLLEKSDVKNAWFGLTNELNQIEWSDGSILDEMDTQWRTLIIDNNSRTRCIRIKRNGEWNDMRCSNELRYICEREGRSMNTKHNKCKQ